MAIAAGSATAIPEKITLENLFDFPEGRRVLTCIQCGTCAATCPHGEEMDFPPRKIIGLLREGFVEEVFESDSLLKCLGCYACEAKCPRDIALTDVLLPLVKEQAFARLPHVPGELQKALESTLRYGTPTGDSPRKRAAWAKTAGVPVPVLSEIRRGVDVLWFLDCYASFHPRGQDNARATARIFHRLGLDFGILGHEEKCSGEWARLLGETGLFETLTESNLRLFAKYDFKRIVTSDAHAYDAFRYQYPALGATPEVDHTTPFLARRIDELKPHMTRRLDLRVTYHDSCALGRHSGFYDEPRALLDSIPGVRLVEMAHNRLNTICCGGGGGGMWLDTWYKSRGMERLSERRVREAIETGAEVLAVSCPYEVSRFEDALKVLGYEKRMVVRDVVELVAEAMEAPGGAR